MIISKVHTFLMKVGLNDKRLPKLLISHTALDVSTVWEKSPEPIRTLWNARHLPHL